MAGRTDHLILIYFRETLLNGQPLNLGDNGTLPVLPPDIYHTGQSFAVTLPPTSIGFWVLTGVQAEPCLPTAFNSTLETSKNSMYHNTRSFKHRQYHNLSHSDQEVDNHITTKSREYAFKDTVNQNNVFSSTILEDTRSETDKGNSESNNTKMIQESQVNVKSKSMRKRDERDRIVQGRYKRYASESGKYLIPGLQPDYVQSNNGLTIKNLIGRRNRGDRLRKLPTILARESDIHSLLHEPYHHVSYEDVNEGLPGISSDKLIVKSFTSSDIYNQYGGKLSEERNNDYDYVDKDEDVYEDDENVPSETEYFHRPTEFSEVFHRSGIAVNQKFAGYRGELPEAESIALIQPHDHEWEQRYNNHDDYKLIQEQGLTAQENHKPTSVATRMLNTYYTDTNKQDSSDDKGEDFEAEKRVTGKYKMDTKKEISNRRRAQKNNHENDYPDLSILTAKSQKAATAALGVYNNKYNDNTDAPAEEIVITRSSHRNKETATKDHNQNIPSIADKYYQEGYRTRRQGKENPEMTKQINDRKITKHDNHENYNKHANLKSFNNTEISNSSHGNMRFSEEKTRQISHKITHNNSDENTSSHNRYTHYKQDSTTNITRKSFQRTTEDSYKDDKDDSRASKQSAQHHAKSKVHNQRMNNKTKHSENDEYNITEDWYAQINPTKVREVDSEERVMNTSSKKIKYHNEQNIGNSKDFNKVHESVSAVKRPNSTEGINPSYRIKSSIRELRNPYRIESAIRQMVTRMFVPTEEQSQEEPDVKYKKKHSSRSEVTSDKSKDMTETDDEQEEAMARKMKASKSRQTNQVTIRMPTSNKDATNRVRRDVPAQLPVMEISKQNTHTWTETENTISHKKDTESQTVFDSINGELQKKSQNTKENKSETAYKTEPVATITTSHKELELYYSTKSSKGTNADHSTQKYSSLNAHKESSGNEHEKYRELTTEVSTNPKQKTGNTLLDKNHYEEYTEAGTNQTYWELQSDGSVEYSINPEQSQKKGNIKRETGSSLLLEPYKDMNVNNSTMVQDISNATQHQNESVLKTVSSVQEGKRQSTTDISPGETVTPVLTDRNITSEHDTKQSMIINNQQGATDVDQVRNTHKTQDGALITKMYQENLDPASGVIRLPKATETHTVLQHGPGKVTNGGINYNKLISSKEKYKHTKNRFKTDKETGPPGVWDIGIPLKMVEVLPVDNSGILSGKVKPSKLEHKGVNMPHDLPPSVMFGKSNKEVTVSETGATVLSKIQHKIGQIQNQSEDTWLHSSGQNAEEENINVESKHGGQSRGWPFDRTMQRYENGQHKHSKHKTSSEQVKQELVSDVVKKSFGDSAPLQTLADITTSEDPSLKNNVKLHTANSDSSDAAPTELSELHVGTATKKFPTINDLRTETLSNLNNIRDNVQKSEDKAFKMTHTIMSSKTAQQSSGDDDSDINGLVHKVKAATAELKTKNEKEEENSAVSAEKALKSITNFTESKFRKLPKKKGNDVTHSKLEDITTNIISDDKNVADALVRNAKDIGHLKHIAVRKENLNVNGLHNTNAHVKLQLFTPLKLGQMRTHLEKKHLEILHSLTAQRAKLKDDLLKIKVMGAEGKLKLPHQINRRDTTQNKPTEPLMSSSETEDSPATISILNEDQTDCSNKDSPSMKSQDTEDTESHSSSYTEKSNDNYYSQDIYKLLEQMFLTLSTVTVASDNQVPRFGNEEVYKTQHYSESELLPRNYLSAKEDQSLVQQPKNSSSGAIPFSVLHDRTSKTMYAERLFPGWKREEKKPNKENVSHISSLNSNSNKIVAEDEYLRDGHIHIKQMYLPLFLPRPVLLNRPMMVQSKRMPTSENDIRFFLDSETDKADANDRDLTWEESHVPPLLLATKSDSPHSYMNAGGTDDASLKESWKLYNNGNRQASLMAVSDKNDPNNVLSQANVLSGVASRKERKGNGKKMHESTHKDRKSEHFKSSNKITESDKSLHSNAPDEVEPSTLRQSETIKVINIHNDICKTCDKQKDNFIFQPLTQQLGNNSELPLGPDDSNPAPIRSERAISYPSNDNLLKASTRSNNKNPRIKDNTNDKYWLQNFFKNNSTRLGQKLQTDEIHSSKYYNVIMSMSNESNISDVAPDSTMLPEREKIKFYSEDTIPATNLYVTNFKLITDYQPKDSENVKDENRQGNGTFLEISSNFLNDIINTTAQSAKGSNMIKDAPRETSNDVNLQTNEINRQFKIADSLLNFEHENSITRANTDGNTVEIKSIPYTSHKHALNSIYEPNYNTHKQRPSEASSEEYPSTATNLHNRSSPSDERSNAIKEVFTIIFEEFPNINNKSKRILESTVSHDGTTISEETPRTAIGHNNISKVPSDNFLTNINNIFSEPNINKQGNESFIVSETYPQENFNSLTGSTENVTTLEQMAQNVEIISNTEEDPEYSDTVNSNTEHKETGNGQQETDHTQREEKLTATTEHVHTFIKNISDNIVKFFHNIPPWNYFSPKHTIRPQ